MGLTTQLRRGAKLRPGDQPLDDQAIERVQVLLTRAQVDWLDDLARQVRRLGGKRLRRTQVLRALLTAMQHRIVQVEGVVDEDSLAEALTASL